MNKLVGDEKLQLVAERLCQGSGWSIKSCVQVPGRREQDNEV